jgi:6-pyruvoyltetrahydropterin/6-carboxytetrahydropterin synthase
VITIAKRFDFDAAHWLPNVPDGHKCKWMHGHTYSVEIVCTGEGHNLLDERGMIVDYAEIGDWWSPISEKIDHQCLNDIDGLQNPTTEILAQWILERLPGAVVRVRVCESSSTWCEVSRD